MRNNRILTLLLSIYVVGILSSFFLADPVVIGQTDSSISVIRIIKTFAMNYWYLFVMWILGLSAIGFAVNLLVVYFRGFLYGLLFLCLMKTNLTYLLVITVIEVMIFLPIFFHLAYSSFVVSFSAISKTKVSLKNYDKLLVIVTVVIFIYSILLEIVGDLYG